MATVEFTWINNEWLNDLSHELDHFKLLPLRMQALLSKLSKPLVAADKYTWHVPVCTAAERLNSLQVAYSVFTNKALLIFQDMSVG